MKIATTKDSYFFSSTNLIQQSTSTPEVSRKSNFKQKDTEPNTISISNLGFTVPGSNIDGKILAKSAREKGQQQVEYTDTTTNITTQSSRIEERYTMRSGSSPQRLRAAHNSAANHSRPALKEILKYKTSDTSVRPVYQIQREEVLTEDKLPSLRVPNLGLGSRNNSRLIDSAILPRGMTASDRGTMNVFDRANSWNQMERSITKFVPGDKIQEITDESFRLSNRKSTLKKIAHGGNDSPLQTTTTSPIPNIAKPAKSNLMEARKVSEVRIVNNFMERKPELSPDVKAPSHKRSNSTTFKELELPEVEKKPVKEQERERESHLLRQRERDKEIQKERELQLEREREKLLREKEKKLKEKEKDRDREKEREKEKEKEKQIRAIFEAEKKIIKPTFVKSILKNNPLLTPKKETSILQMIPTQPDVLNKSVNLLRRTGMLPKKVRFQM